MEGLATTLYSVREPSFLETRSYVNLSLYQPEIRLSSQLNSGKILGVLKEGSTSWQHICTETQINYEKSLKTYQIGATNLTRKSVILKKRRRSCLPCAGYISLWLLANLSLCCYNIGGGDPSRKHTDQKPGRACNAAMWSSVARNRNRKSSLKKSKLLIDGVHDLFDISSSIPMVSLKGKV